MSKKMFRSIVSMLLAVCMLIPLVTTSTYAADTIKLSKTILILPEGKKTTLTVSGTSKTVTWSTSNKKIAAVTQDGSVSGKSAGIATITATVGGQKLTCKVTVNSKKITPEVTNLKLKAGDSESVVFLKNANISDITCGTTDKTIATAKLNAKKTAVTITGVGAGTVSIKLYSKSDKTISSTINVTVSGTNKAAADTSDTSSKDKETADNDTSNTQTQVSETKIMGKYDGDTYINEYFNFKADFTDYTFDEPDYTYSSKEFDFILFEMENRKTYASIEYIDMTKAGYYVDGFSSSYNATQFVEYMLTVGTNYTADYFYKTYDGSTGSEVKKSEVTIAGKKAVMLYIGTYDENGSPIYQNIAAVRQGKYMLVYQTISYNKNSFEDFTSCISQYR